MTASRLTPANLANRIASSNVDSSLSAMLTPQIFSNVCSIVGATGDTRIRTYRTIYMVELRPEAHPTGSHVAWGCGERDQERPRPGDQSAGAPPERCLSRTPDHANTIRCPHRWHPTIDGLSVPARGTSNRCGPVRHNVPRARNRPGRGLLGSTSQITANA